MSVTEFSILTDKEVVKELPLADRKSALADAISHGVEVILSEKNTLACAKMAAEGTRLLLEKATLYLRFDADESYLDSICKGAAILQEAKKASKETILHDLVTPLERNFGGDHGALSGMVISAIVTKGMYLPEERLELLCEAFSVSLEKVMLKSNGRRLTFIGQQIAFVYRYIAAEEPDYPGTRKLWSLINKANPNVHKKSYLHTKEQLFQTYLRAYHKKSTWEGIVDIPSYAKQKERLVFVQGLQKLTLETLVLTKNFLDENNLRFFLGEGTMLGAVRHHGFIPWDDDVDILMPREDYDKLIELSNQGKVPPELNLDALENNPLHWVLGAKMQLTRPTDYVQEKVKHLSKCYGPYVDIFPLDYWPKEMTHRQMDAYKKVKVARRMLFMKTGYSTKIKGKPHRVILYIATHFISNESIEKWAVKNMKKFQDQPHNYMINLCSYYKYSKETFPADYFSEAVMMPFEGELMPVPKEYDECLKLTYSPYYDTIPPVKVTKMRKHAFALRQDVEEKQA